MGYAFLEAIFIPLLFLAVDLGALEFGQIACPRASISLARSAKALAFLQGFDFVGPAHVQALAHDVLRHRLTLSYRAEADGITPDHFIDELIARVPVP